MSEVTTIGVLDRPAIAHGRARAFFIYTLPLTHISVAQRPGQSMGGDAGGAVDDEAEADLKGVAELTGGLGGGGAAEGVVVEVAEVVEWVLNIY